MRNLLSLSHLASLATAAYVVPGAHWRDTNGTLVNAHVGGANYDPTTATSWLRGGGHTVADNYSDLYTYVDAYSLLGNWSQDFGLFTDLDTERSYSLYSNGDTREGRDVYLTSFNEDMTQLKEVIFQWDKTDLEVPSIVKTDVGYFEIMSHKTVYRPNNVVAYHAEKLQGPWSQPWIANLLNTRGLNSQSGNTLAINGSKKTTHLYLGDRWNLNANWEATYIWLPLLINEKQKSLKIVWVDAYDLDVLIGQWTVIEGATYHTIDATLNEEAPHQEAQRNHRNQISENDSTINFEGYGDGDKKTVSFYYQNTDDIGFGNTPYGSPDLIDGI